MKIIDLLNKIAKGEEVPYRIELKSGIVLFYCPDTKNYYNDLGCNELFDSWITDKLNDEVKILDKKIKRIQSCGDNLYSEYIGQWLVNKENYTEYDELLMNKINEIIDILNEEEK